jgi:hypothetical protein
LGWLRIKTGGEQLWMRKWTFGFNKLWGISWLAINHLASQEGLYSMQWVSIVRGYCYLSLNNNSRTFTHVIKF